MRRYLLDAGPLSALLLGRAGAVALMRPWLRDDEAATSVIVYGEVVEYIRTRANYSSNLRLQLRPEGRLIGDIDTLIAATALERGLTILTADRDFARIPGRAILQVTKQQLA